MPSKYNIKKIDGDAVTWTAIPVTGTLGCSGFTIQNKGAASMLYRTDDTDPLTEITLLPDDLEVFPAHRANSAPIFVPGDSLGFFKTVSGTGPCLKRQLP